MVKFHKAQTTYQHPFPAVSLAYFIRYPNPYSTHVLSTDTISRELDPITGRLRTVRLHLKQSKLPSAVLKLLPKGITGAHSPDGHARNYILETTVVDPKEGWMETETRNLQYTGVLTVIEQQRYTRPGGLDDAPVGVEAATNFPASPGASRDLVSHTKGESTDASTTVTLVSRLGQQARPAQKTAEEEPARRPGFLTSWSTAALQRAIEASGVQRTRTATVKSREGMLVVLERIRNGGLMGALEGMRRDRELMMGGVVEETAGQTTWIRGKDPGSDSSSTK
jgi:4-amino-4-deoxychorismate lyase